MKRWREFSGSYAPHNPIFATVERWTAAAAPGSPHAGLINRTLRAPAQVSANPKSALTPIPQLGRGTNPKQVKCVAHGETCGATSRCEPSNCLATAATPWWRDAANATHLPQPRIGCGSAARRRTRRGATCCLCLASKSKRSAGLVFNLLAPWRRSIGREESRCGKVREAQSVHQRHASPQRHWKYLNRNTKKHESSS